MNMLTRDDVLAVVRGYHDDGETQPALAEKHGISRGYVHKLVHGQAWPDVYKQVAAEHASAEAEQQATEGGS